MKISPKIIELAQSIKDPQELVELCQKEGVEINTHQAQKLIEMSEFSELDEDDLGTVSGGCNTPKDCPICNKHDKVSIGGAYDQWRYWCNRCDCGFDEKGKYHKY